MDFMAAVDMATPLEGLVVVMAEMEGLMQILQIMAHNFLRIFHSLLHFLSQMYLAVLVKIAIIITVVVAVLEEMEEMDRGPEEAVLEEMGEMEVSVVEAAEI